MPPLRLVGSDAPIAETAAEDADRLIHELSNLLDGSLRSVGLALSGLDDAAKVGAIDAETREHISHTSEALRQMAALIGQQASGHKPDLAAPYKPDRALGEVVDHVMRVTSAAAKELNISLFVEIADDVAGHPCGQVYPVLVNGVRNAIESIGRDGAVQVEAFFSGDNLEVRINDTGEGVSPSLPRDNDGLVAPGVTTKPRGQGLGLAISRDIVRALGGVIRLEDGEDGVGATLVIRLPITDPPGAPA